LKIAFNSESPRSAAANLLEDPGGELKVENHAVLLDLRRRQIRSIRLWLGDR
jgi:hypothetical protein